MRSEISNELLLQVIQAWDPAKASPWEVDVSELRCRGYFIRNKEGDMYPTNNGSLWKKAIDLVEFLLKDRPDLGLLDEDRSWKKGVPALKCERATRASWNSDPWKKGCMEPERIVNRIKSYEYLKEWKEKQENAVNPHDITLSIDGQTIDMIPGEPTVWKTKTLKGVPAPGTYEQICPQCNGSKEVTGWLGKEPCSACC